MPPKKRTNKKNSGKSSNNDGLGLAPEDKVKQLQCQIDALQAQLAERTEVAANATARSEEMQQRMVEDKALYDEEKETSLAVVRDMTRQHKAMQEQLLNKINERENTIQNLRDGLERMKNSHEMTIKDKDGEIQKRDGNVKALEDRMDNLCIEFSNMLSEMLGKMTKDLATHSMQYEDACQTGLHDHLHQLYLDSISSITDKADDVEKVSSC